MPLSLLGNVDLSLSKIHCNPINRISSFKKSETHNNGINTLYNITTTGATTHNHFLAPTYTIFKQTVSY